MSATAGLPASWLASALLAALPGTNATFYDGTGAFSVPPATAAAAAANLAIQQRVPHLSVASFMPTGLTFGIGKSQPLSGAFATLAAAQAAYPFAVALSQETDRCALQACFNAANTATGSPTKVLVPPCIGAKIDQQLVINASTTCVEGTRGGVTGGTRLWFGQMAAGVPGIRITGGCLGYGEAHPLSDVILDARAGQGGGMPNTAVPSGTNATLAVAHTNYLPGSVAVTIDATDNCTLTRVAISGFDQPFWLGADCWSITWRSAYIVGNNFGAGYVAAPSSTNAGEKMRWEGGTFSNNNWGLRFQGMENVSSTNYVTGASVDYNNLGHVMQSDTRGLNAINVVFLQGCHFETSNDTSGNGARIIPAGGSIFAHGCTFSEQGGNSGPLTVPQCIGLVNFPDPTGASGSVRIRDCFLIGQASIPLCYQADTNFHDFDADGCCSHYPTTSVVAYSSPNGQRVQRDTAARPTTIPGGATVTLGAQFQNRTIYLTPVAGAAATVVVPADSDFNHEVGSFMHVVLLGAGTCSVYFENGVSVTKGPAVSQFGSANATGSKFDLWKSGNNSWVLTN